MYRILLIICLFLGIYSCQSNRKHQQTTDLSNNSFEISARQVGSVKKGMTIKELQIAIPEDRIKKLESRNELSGGTLENFYIYDDSSRLLLIVSPEHHNDEGSRIARVIIKDKRFTTASGIGLHSNVGEIRKAYPHNDFIPSVDNIVLFIPEIDGNFEISKRYLTPSVWNDTTGLIVADSIPAKTNITAITVCWTYNISTLADKTFWHDLTRRLLNWLITQVPSIAILTLLFVGLMRLLHFIVRRLEKAATNRIYKAGNIDMDEGQKRINTLSGIIHGVGRIFLWTIYILILLGKFNINIAPILASAGIVGLAVGFGAQELVRDFISGFFILLEDQIRTGDVAIINGTSGTVEKIEMRTTTLRDASGVVHIFQNGKINTLSNMTKGWSAIVLDIGVAYKEDTDRVARVMQEVGAELMKEPEYSTWIIEPVNVLGIDQFGDSAVVIKVKLTTKSGMQWTVSREYRRRLKKAFDQQNIEMPFPHLSIYTGEATKPMPIEMKNEK
ncbi:MAG: mechanosensitive ion channel family protein [Odoribacter sp.]